MQRWDKRGPYDPGGMHNPHRPFHPPGGTPGWGFVEREAHEGRVTTKFRIARPGYRPRGPKGYQRRDERIQEDIYELLMQRDDIDSSDVTVDVKDGHVTLDGTVPERWMRYVVDDIAESILGVKEVDNRVRVRRSEGDDSLRAQLMGNERRLPPSE